MAVVVTVHVYRRGVEASGVRVTVVVVDGRGDSGVDFDITNRHVTLPSILRGTVCEHAGTRSADGRLKVGLRCRNVRLGSLWLAPCGPGCRAKSVRVGRWRSG